MAGRFGNEPVSGLRAAKDAFKALPQVTRDRTNQAVEDTTQAIYRGAVRRVAPHRRYGFLQRYLDTSMNRKTGTGKVGLPRLAAVIPAGPSAGFMSRTVRAGKRRFEIIGRPTAGHGTRVVYPSKYAHLVEFGHRRGRGTSAAPAYPFMIPSAEAERSKFLTRCQEAGRGIERDMAAIGLSGTSGNRFV